MTDNLPLDDDGFAAATALWADRAAEQLEQARREGEPMLLLPVGSATPRDLPSLARLLETELILRGWQVEVTWDIESLILTGPALNTF
jgi:hypothetical protein